MNNKEIVFDENARKGILAGIEKIAKAVKSTLGPKGRNVLIGTDDRPIVTKDGITVCKAIKLEDNIENIGAQAIIEASGKTADLGGDGTTTTVVLAEAIYKEGMRYLASGHNPILLKRGIDEAVSIIIDKIKRQSKPINNNEEIKQIAVVSANWDNEIGSLIAQAIDKVGKDGVVTIEESKTADTTLTTVEGMQFDRGYISPYFINDEATSKCILEDAYILLHERKLNNIQELLPILQKVSKTSKPLLIIAEDIDNEVLSTLVINKLRGSLQVCAIKAPGFGERRKAYLDDIAVATGGTVVEAELNKALNELDLNDLGRARKIIVTKTNVTIIEGKGNSEKIQNRILSIKNMIEEQTSDFEKDKYRDRLAKLNGIVAIINIGAATETELKEKRMRIDDALAATRAAIEEGISAGGSTALLKTYNYLQEHLNTLDKDNTLSAGIKIVLNAIKAPLICLCENAGLDSHIIVSNVIDNKQDLYGFDITTGTYCNMIEKGIIDPTKVTRLSLQNAASIAGLLLSSECVIFDKKENEDKIK